GTEPAEGWGGRRRRCHAAVQARRGETTQEGGGENQSGLTGHGAPRRRQRRPNGESASVGAQKGLRNSIRARSPRDRTRSLGAPSSRTRCCRCLGLRTRGPPIGPAGEGGSAG